MSEGSGTIRGCACCRWLLIAACSVFALTQFMGLLQLRPDIVQPQPVADPTGRAIDRIEFTGLVNVDPAVLFTVIRSAPGDIWDRDTVAEDCARLAATGKFEGSPYAEARETDGLLVLVFVVRERPFLTEITFVGHSKFKTHDLLNEIGISVGSPISEFLIDQARDQITAKYKEAGYAYVTVEVDRNVLDTEQRVLFRISEGPRIKVRDIVFEGNAAFGRRKLMGLIETETYIWLFRTGSYDEETAERDAAAIQKHYVDRGYLNARVGFRGDVDEEDDLSLIFQIEEGGLHLIKTIVFDGNTVFDDDQLLAALNADVGGPVDVDILTADRNRIIADYGRLGYVYCDVVPSRVFDEEDPYVNLTFSINEGEQYRIGEVVIRGNRYTRDKVVRRELRFFPEELYDTEATGKAEQRLVETRLFSEATITPQGVLPGVRDVLVDVAETETTSLLFGVGVTTNSGLVGSISIEQRNFDLFDWPRSAAEFFGGRSFRGAGQTLRLQIEPGTELTRGLIEFREPYLLDKELGFNIGAYIFQRGRDAYSEERFGFSTSIDKRFREGFLRNWAAELALRFEAVRVKDVDPFTARDIEDVKGNNWITSLKGTLVRDTTDSRWLPSEGNRLQFSWEQAGALGGDFTFSKLIGQYDHYITVKRDSFDRKHILQFGATVGNIFGNAPVFERFYAGGIGSIRGFEFRGISPRDGARSDRIGGDFMMLTNAQYSFPLAGKNIRGVTFLDMGTVEDNFKLTNFRASVGVGARIYIKYFGPIPLAFDLAFPIAEDSEDDTQVFNFSFGTTF
ncbi:MAG: outer membrane protein assembly factor BamA [Planctomycetota bacterium]|nr:outer membrane protein assembly factor BamA [Planctomycetota bacterium]